MDNYPALVSCKPLDKNYEHLKKIPVSSDKFSLGRSLSNSAVIPFLAISRNHCEFKKSDNGWTIVDHSHFGVEVNGCRLGNGKLTKLHHDDIITLEPSKEFVYKFCHPEDDIEIPRKRIKLENTNDNDNITDLDLMHNVKLKFEESQTNEIKRIETKIQSAKQMQSTSIMLKEQLQVEMDKKMQHLEAEYAAQIENLQGEKNEVERQKALLLEERDAQLTAVKLEMETKIEDLLEQIRKNKESETTLMQQNNELKEKLDREREEFMATLSRETSSKQDIMEQLEAKIREQEDIRAKEREEFEQMLQNETEKLRLAKEKELKELEEQKKLRELELTSELDKIKKSLAERVQESEQQRLIAERRLNEQMEEMKKLSDEEKAKMDQLLQERLEIERKLAEAEINAQKNVVELKQKIDQREVELATLAAERIQFQADQTGEVISALQAQLENVKAQLKNVETEKNTLMECLDLDPGEGTSKQGDNVEVVGEIMDTELTCSICSELFIEATTLNCSHTFCKYCISMWKKKKKDCPHCRAPIKSECRSLALDCFIEKMSERNEDLKKKRQEALKTRAELGKRLDQPRDANRARRRIESSSSSGSSDSYSSDDSTTERSYDEEGGYESDAPPDYEEYDDYRGSEYGDGDEYDDFEHFNDFGPGGSDEGGSDGSGSDASSDGSDQSPGNRAQWWHGPGGRRRRRGGHLSHEGQHIEGLPGYHYGGYGSCYVCGAIGHWAPGCPFR